MERRSVSFKPTKKVSGVPAFQGHHRNQEAQMVDNLHPGI